MSSVAAAPPAGRPPRALRQPAYLLLWATMLSANGARWAFTMLASYVAFVLTHSAAWVGLTVFALQMPAIALAPVAGVVADRVSRVRMLVWAIGVSFVAAVAALVLFELGRLTPLLLVLVALVLGIGTTVQSTAQNTLLPQTVPPAALFEAVALQGTARQGAEFFGPALATAVLALFGRTAALSVVALLFALGLVPCLFLSSHERRADRASARSSEPRPGPWTMVKEGARYVAGPAALVPTMVLISLHCLLTMAYMGMLPGLATDGGMGGNAAYGGLMTTVGLGAAAGTLGIALVGRSMHPGRLLWVLSLLSGVGVAALGAVRGVVALELAALVVGGATASFMAIALLRIQRATRDERMRGRVMSLYLMLAGGAMALGNWGYGALAGVVPIHLLPILSGGLFIAIVLTAPTLFGSVRAIYGEMPQPQARHEIAAAAKA